MVEIKPLPKIVPLWEDMIKTIKSSFLLSTPFKRWLVELLESIGFDESNLFCSSVDGYGVDLGEDIFDTLKNLFLEHDLFVIFVHSPRYYESPVSLNEMGAAWVLKTNFCSFLTQEMKFDTMKGVVKSDSIAIKVDAEDVKARLNEQKDKLCTAFNLESISQTKWERKRDRFIEKFKSFNVDFN